MSSDTPPIPVTPWYKQPWFTHLLAALIPFTLQLIVWLAAGRQGPPPTPPLITPDDLPVIQDGEPLIVSYWNDHLPGYAGNRERDIGVAARAGRKVLHTGWQPNPEDLAAIKDTLPQAYFADTPAGRVVLGDDKPAYLWQAAAKARAPPLTPRNQLDIGSCGSFGSGNSVDCLQLVQIANGEPKEFFPVVNEAIYGMGRVDIGKSKVRRLPSEGMMVSWAVLALQKEGSLARKKYPSYDLSTYSVDLCRQWGNRGVPAALKDEARHHLVKEFTYCRTTAEMVKALQQGFPIAYGGPVGVNQQRDKNGIAKWDRTWGHSMAILGWDPHIDAFFFWNSWGNDYHRGPKGPGDPPDGGFWFRRADMEKVLRLPEEQGVEVIALSDAEGFPARKMLDWSDITRAERNPRRVFDMPFALAP